MEGGNIYSLFELTKINLHVGYKLKEIFFDSLIMCLKRIIHDKIYNNGGLNGINV